MRVNREGAESGRSNLGYRMLIPRPCPVEIKRVTFQIIKIVRY